jgi:hypothetical protein
MKTLRIKSSLLAALACLALTPFASRAASDIAIGPTGTEASISNPDGTWIHMWNGVGAWSTSFDPANPPPSGDTAGSVYNQGTWTGGGQDNYNTANSGNWWGAVTFDGSQYASIEFDVKYDTNSTILPASSAHLDVGFDTGYHLESLTTLSFNRASSPLADGAWHHVSIPVPASRAGISAAHSVGYYQWNPASSGTMNFWMANVVVVARVVPVAPPTLSTPVKTTPGLNVFASTEGNSFFDRQEVELRQTTGLSWVGQATTANPVTYSFTIKDYPKSVNCEAYLFLVPNPTANDEAPDWNQTNCAIAYVQGNSSSATMRFRYKVNEDHQQAMYSGGSETRGFYTNAPGSWDGVTPNYLESGDLGFVTNNGVLGTWTVKFTSDTNGTLIAPNGNTKSFVMPAYNASYFAESSGFNVYLGMQANNADAINQAVVYSNFAITGVPSAMSDNFLADSTLDTVVWNNGVSHGPAGVLVVPSTAAYWLRWTLPDTGFSLQTASAVNGPWSSLTAGPIIPLFGIRQQQVASSELPGQTAFFRLIKRNFTQLQVLLPGESNAPDTVSGKTGTPTAVNQGDLVNVTINAVDATWHIVNVSGQTIHLTTNDPQGVTPNDSALTGGTMNAYVVFGSSGSWTVTASDVTDPTKTSNTSTAQPVN